MKMKTLIFVTTFGSTAVFAHEGVQNPQVMARMTLMTDIAKEMEAFSAIAKEETAFDAEAVKQRADNLAAHARGIITLFEMEASDPKSEAREEIWTDWSGFTTATEEMERAAQALGSTNTLDGFRSAFRGVGQSCTACHKDYRINKN